MERSAPVRIVKLARPAVELERALEGNLVVRVGVAVADAGQRREGGRADGVQLGPVLSVLSPELHGTACRAAAVRVQRHGRISGDRGPPEAADLARTTKGRPRLRDLTAGPALEHLDLKVDRAPAFDRLGVVLVALLLEIGQRAHSGGRVRAARLEHCGDQDERNGDGGTHDEILEG